MRFETKTAEQLKQERPVGNFEPFPKGEYDFEIIEAVDKTSSAGNDMIAVNMKIFNANGEYRFVRDFLVSTAVWKLHQIAKATGLEAAYENGQIEAYMLDGQIGRVKVKIEDNEQYGPQNKVVEYVASTAKISERTQAAYTGKSVRAAADLDDEIPF